MMYRLITQLLHADIFEHIRSMYKRFFFYFCLPKICRQFIIKKSLDIYDI